MSEPFPIIHLNMLVSQENLNISRRPIYLVTEVALHDFVTGIQNSFWFMETCVTGRSISSNR